MRQSVLGSMLTRQYRFATRGIGLTLRTARTAIDIAEGVVIEVADRLGLHDGHGEPEAFTGEVVPEAEPRPEPPEPRRAPRAEPAPPSPATPHGDPMPTSPAASTPAPPAPRAPEPPTPPGATEPPSAPPPASSPAPSHAASPAPPPTPSPAPPPAAPPPAPAHVDVEAEVVEEFSEPGAEDGAGAQVRIGEPWPGYRHLKARDVIARLPMATREELAAVELFELAGANRKSVVVAARRALKQASPPR